MYPAYIINAEGVNKIWNDIWQIILLCVSWCRVIIFMPPLRSFDTRLAANGLTAGTASRSFAGICDFRPQPRLSESESAFQGVSVMTPGSVTAGKSCPITSVLFKMWPAYLRRHRILKSLLKVNPCFVPQTYTKISLMVAGYLHVYQTLQVTHALTEVYWKERAGSRICIFNPSMHRGWEISKKDDIY